MTDVPENKKPRLRFAKGATVALGMMGTLVSPEIAKAQYAAPIYAPIPVQDPGCTPQLVPGLEAGIQEAQLQAQHNQILGYPADPRTQAQIAANSQAIQLDQNDCAQAQTNGYGAPLYGAPPVPYYGGGGVAIPGIPGIAIPLGGIIGGLIQRGEEGDDRQRYQRYQQHEQFHPQRQENHWQQRAHPEVPQGEQQKRR